MQSDAASNSVLTATSTAAIMSASGPRPDGASWYGVQRRALYEVCRKARGNSVRIVKSTPQSTMREHTPSRLLWLRPFDFNPLPDDVRRHCIQVG